MDFLKWKRLSKIKEEIKQSFHHSPLGRPQTGNKKRALYDSFHNIVNEDFSINEIL